MATNGQRYTIWPIWPNAYKEVGNEKKYFGFTYDLAINSLAIMVIALALWSFNPAVVRAQAINSIEPNKGNTTQSTPAIINGADFKSPPQAALYGGGPYITGSCDKPKRAYSVAISFPFAYVVDNDSGFHVIAIAISTPSSPNIMGSCHIPGAAFGVAISGTCAYVADVNSGLQVIDISTPSSPNIIGSCGTPGPAYGVAISGTCAYVADEGSGLQVIDISNPSSPHIIGSCHTPGIAYGVAISGTCAYVADVNSGLQVIDISNPSSPHIIGSFDTPGYAFGIAISGTFAYVADVFSGLQVIEKFRPLEDISYIDSGTIMATVPAGYRPGTYNLHVINPDGGYTMLHNAFTVEEGDCTTYYKDADVDGYGASGDTQCLCASQPPYTATQGGDCNDTNPAINPSATEVCDGKGGVCT